MSERLRTGTLSKRERQGQRDREIERDRDIQTDRENERRE